MSTTSIAFIDLRINTAEQVKESVSESVGNTSLYLMYGKTDSWANDSAPSIANASIATRNEVWSNFIGGKRILGGNIMHVIPRVNWTANTAYTAFDHMNENIHDTNFYVMNSGYSVYKCLSNGNGKLSTVEPTSLIPGVLSTTSDGYVWKYMYTVNGGEQFKFTTSDFIPVKTLSGNDGSLQWQVQDLAADGAIDAIFVLDGGENYTNVSNITITITGDGSGATARPTLNTVSNTIDSIYIVDHGINYTYATANITDAGTGTGAILKPIIGPPGGHGKDPLYELGGKNLMIDVSFNYNEAGQLIDSNDYRQVTLLKDPKLYNSSNVATSIILNQTMILTVSGTGDYNADELVYQGRNYSLGTFKGRVLSWDSTNSKLYLINTSGIPTSRSVIGASSITARSVNSVENPDLDVGSGKILYTDNFEPITRSSDQIEDFKIVLKF